MTDLIRRADALAKIHWLSNADWTAAERRAAGEIAATITSLPAVTVGVETCSRCCGCGMTIGDGGDPRICPKCKGDGVEPVAAPDPAAIREAALREVLDILESYGAAGEAITDEVLAIIAKGAADDRA